MQQAARFHRVWTRVITSRHPVKVTALYQLREALLNEVYEDCPLAIQIAREFGAQEFEIENLLEDPRRRPL